MRNHFMCVCICLCPWRAELCIKGLAHGGNRLSGACEIGGRKVWRPADSLSGDASPGADTLV